VQARRRAQITSTMGRRHGVIGNRHGSPLHFLELEPPIIELLLLLGPAPAA